MIKFNKVTFAYNKNNRGIDELSLHIPHGHTKGLIGHNGAGKTTLLRLVLGLIQPQEGIIKVGNYEPNDKKLPRGLISYVPELIGVYEKLTGFQNLEFRARAARIDPLVIETESEKWLRRFGLLKRADEKVGYWSKGMKQRLSLACALISAPQILLLDEPTNGLDPESRALFKTILKDVQQEVKTIILCSHDLDFVYALCDSITILQYGKDMLSGRLPKSAELLTDLYLKYTAGLDMEKD